MKRAALLTSVLVLALAGCGGTRDDAALPAPGSGTPTASRSSPATSSDATRTAPPATSPSAGTSSTAPQECPIKATTVPPPPGATTDLSVKPTIPPHTAPPPTTVTVADIVEGTGAEATTLSTVEAKYVGALYESGQEFDSSWKTGPDETISFTVCATGTIPGFAIAPTGMKVGGRRQVTIPAELGYGAAGSPPTIPGGAALVFVIDLVKVTPPAG